MAKKCDCTASSSGTWSSETPRDVGRDRIWSKDKTCAHGKLIDREITNREHGINN